MRTTTSDVCDECGNSFDDNPGKRMCKTCEDWLVGPDTMHEEKECWRCVAFGKLARWTPKLAVLWIRLFGSRCTTCNGTGYVEPRGDKIV